MFCSNEAADRLFFFLPSFQSYRLRRRETKKEGTLDTLSFLVPPTKRRPAWPFGYCKISNSVFYLAHFISQHSLWARIGVRECLTHSPFLSLCADCGVASQSRRLKVSPQAFIPATVTRKPALTQRRVKSSEVFILLIFFFPISQSEQYSFCELACVPLIRNSPFSHWRRKGSSVCLTQLFGTFWQTTS